MTCESARARARDSDALNVKERWARRQLQLLLRSARDARATPGWALTVGGLVTAERSDRACVRYRELLSGWPFATWEIYIHPRLVIGAYAADTRAHTHACMRVTQEWPPRASRSSSFYSLYPPFCGTSSSFFFSSFLVVVSVWQTRNIAPFKIRGAFSGALSKWNFMPEKNSENCA